MNTFIVAFCVALCITATFGQTSLGPCIGGSCPTGYTCQTSTNMCLTSGGSTTTCADIRNSKGVNECPGKAYLCNNSVYYTLMTSQCPRTCNRCPTTG
uniref:ShKT domain-containing protein n=1 Tax=Panagrolaimus davidi TaxID=227884 RepID=A0A914QKF0_9BILA